MCKWLESILSGTVIHGTPLSSLHLEGNIIVPTTIYGMDRNYIVGVLFCQLFLPQILKNFICSIDSPRRPEYAHKFLGKSYRRNKSYETSKFSKMVTYKPMDCKSEACKMKCSGK